MKNNASEQTGEEKSSEENFIKFQSLPIIETLIKSIDYPLKKEVIKKNLIKKSVIHKTQNKKIGKITKEKIIFTISAIFFFFSGKLVTVFIIRSKKSNTNISLNQIEKNIVSIKRDLYEIVQYNDTKIIENTIDVSEEEKTVVNEIIYTNFLVNIYNITKLNENRLSQKSTEDQIIYTIHKY